MRPVSEDYARIVIAHLLAVEFPGRDELAGQALTARFIADDRPTRHATEIGLEIVDRVPAPVTSWAPVSGSAADTDGVPIDFILHVSPSGILEGLEIVRLDGNPIQEMPEPSSIQVFVARGRPKPASGP